MKSRLTLIEEKSEKRNGYWYGKYQCSCGKIKIIRNNSVVYGEVISCGCARIKIISKASKLILIEGKIENKNNRWFGKYKCSCGNVIIANESSVRYGHKKDCGCGKKSNTTIPENSYLTLIEANVGKTKHGHIENRYQCRCGKLVVIAGSRVVNGNTKSCGCYKISLATEQSSTHKLSHTRLYKIWSGMKKRCLNPNSSIYKNYGGRGITICDEWMSFQVFHDWARMNEYEDNLTIDRKNNDGNYEPSNCRWITKKENSWNKRNTVGIENAIKVRELLDTGESIRNIVEKTGIKKYTVIKIKTKTTYAET